MFGRDSELESVLELVERGSVVTILGPGGVGKTTLAAAAAEGAGRPFLMADLHSVEGGELAQVLAGELGFRSWHDLVGGLARRRQLLLLDGAEGVVPELSRIVDDLTGRFQNLTVLVTSRSPLDLTSERIFRLQPFDLTGSPSEAARYFHWLMQMRGLSAPSDLEAIESICESLDGLPLALELAAGYAASLTPTEIADRVTRGHDLLAHQGKTGQPSSLAATIDWSLDLLDPVSRELVESLSMFEGPFTVELASSLAGKDDDSELVRLLNGLVERSLLLHMPSANVSWYGYLNTIRSHCRERLTGAGRSEMVTNQMVDAIATVADQLADPEVLMADPLVPDKVRRMFTSIKGAVSVLIERGEDSESIARMLFPLFWLEDVGHQAEAVDLIGLVIDRLSENDEAKGIILGLGANLQKAVGRFAEAEASASAAIASGSVKAMFLGRRALGLIKRASGDPGTAFEHFRIGAELARSVRWEGHALELDGLAALALADTGDLDTAIHQIERAELAGRDYALCHRCLQLFMIGLLIHRDADRARILALEVAEASRHLGHRWVTGGASYFVAIAAILGGEEAVAVKYLGLAIRAFESAHLLAELQQALLVASTLLARSGLHGAERVARAGLQENMRGHLTSLDRELLTQLGVDVDMGRDPDADFDVEVVVSGLLEIADGTGLAADDRSGQEEQNLFRQEGDLWRVAYRGRQAFVRDSKGMEDLASLLSRPTEQMAALDLMGAVIEETDPGPPIDDAARRQYETRIVELQREIDEAQDSHDTYRAESSSRELDQLVEQLTSAFGLTGSPRSRATAERARNAVRWRIRAAIDRIREMIPELGEHLDLTVRTGRFCHYSPESHTTWQT